MKFLFLVVIIKSLVNINHKKQILSERKQLEKSGRLNWGHYFILGISILLTFAAWYFSKQQVDQKIEAEFERQVNRVKDQITLRMTKYEDALWAGVATIHSQSHGIDYEEWKRFSRTLRIEDKYPGINGIGIIYYVLPENMQSYLERERDLRPDYKIHPDHNEKEFLPITYIEPVESNEAAVGLDMAHEANRYKAALMSRDTGLAQITAPITLVQDAEKTPGFLFYVPFYKDSNAATLEDRRANFRGLVYAPFIMSRLLEGTLGQDRREISLRIEDGDDVLYDELNAKNSEYNKDSKLRKNIVITKYGRSWNFTIESNRSFEGLVKNNQPLIILISGIAINFLLMTLFLVWARTNKRALKFADRMTENYQNELAETVRITEELKEEKDFQELIINTIPSFFFVKDDEFKIVSANKAFLNNYPEEKRDKVIGYTTLEEYSDDEVAVFLKQDKIAFKNGVSKVEETINFPNGESKVLFTKKIRFSSKGKNFILGISDDISVMKKAEQEILRSNMELEKFAYLASHDLQEPLRMVKSFTQIFKEDYGESFDDQANMYMDQILSGANRMQALVRDLLDYSRVQDSDIVLKETDSQDCLEEAVKNLDEIIKATSAEITFENLPVVQSVPVRLMRLFQNLIGNAIKYTDDGVVPKIHVIAEGNDKEWIFSISDNGIGMKDEYLEKIFTLFKRLHNKDEYSGTGIGLAICEKIVDSLNGRIWATSKEGQGSVFYFSIPK